MSRFPMVLLAAFLALTAPAYALIQTSAEHALLMDGGSGQVLWEKDGRSAMTPASMSKLMTLELLFGRLKDGRLKLADTFPVSERAWRTGGSKGFVRVGDRLTIEDLIQRIIIASGNDACVVVAEGVGGTVDGFVGMMNARARQLGLDQSHFVNPDGLPDPPGQLMSALDLARLSRHLIDDYPQYYHYFSEKNYTVSDRGKQIAQPNRDLLLDKFPGADGLKTGHTDLAGYGITASAAQGGRRLILVLNGLRYPNAKNDYFPNIYRADEAARILGIAFREFRSFDVIKPGQVLGSAPVAGGVGENVALEAKPLALLMQVDSRAAMKIALHIDAHLQAPIVRGQRLGTLSVTAPDFPAFSTPVYAAEAVPQAGFFRNMWRKARGMMGGR